MPADLAGYREAWIAAAVASMPPLSDEDLEKLAVLLRGPTGARDD